MGVLRVRPKELHEDDRQIGGAQPKLSGSVLEVQLMKLLNGSNHFKAHALASLHVLDRRRRRGDVFRPCSDVSLIPPTPAPLASAEDVKAALDLLDSDECELIRDSLPFTRQHTAPVPPRPTAKDEKTLELTTPKACNEPQKSDKAKTSEGPVAVSLSAQLIKRERKAPLLHSVTSLPGLERGFYDWPMEIIDLLESSSLAEVSQRAEGDGNRGCGLQLLCGSSQIPHPKKAETGGEDSLFVCPKSSAVGVSDGVGEWEWRFGLNPRAFADELMLGAQHAAQRTRGEARLSAQDRAAVMLEEGYKATHSFGSATALVAALDPNGASELGVANLGDSGLRVLRWHQGCQGGDVGVRVAHRTIEQQHAFNCPFQLSRLPVPEDFDRLRSQGLNALVRAVQSTCSSKQDLPAHADTYNFKVQEGDLLLLGTDGVFDNLHDYEVCQLVSLAAFPVEASELGAGSCKSRCTRSPTDPANLALAIAKAAHFRSQDQGAKTPFGATAREAGLHHVGGKMDDISVVAAWVVRG